ncbi:phosphotransferase [Bacillus salacetis]|nr:phosphotransferase [Bacillus salacetis]
MILKTKEKGGDGFQNRLLFLLKETLGDESIRITKIKEGKWRVQAGKDQWFLKLYPTRQKFQLQRAVAQALHQEGFLRTPGYHPVHEGSSEMKLDEKIAGLTEWVHTGKIFTYHTFKDRHDALSVVEGFHDSSRRILKKDSIQFLPGQVLIEKWKKRLQEFRSNRQNLSEYVPLAMIDSYIQIGQTALLGLLQHGFSDESCILHGDLAHHNFIRGTNNEMYLIDLDLITRGPCEIDYIQFANRILPFCGWSLDKLWRHKPLSEYKDDKAFLFGILFPSDIFREWNRFFREGTIYRHNVWNYLMELTVNQFHHRMVCSRDIQSLL